MDYLAMELALLKQRYQLAKEEVGELRARVARLETLLRALAGDPGLDPGRLVLAVAARADGPFSAGEVTVVDAETLREPFGPRRSAPPDVVELVGHDLAAAITRSRELVGLPSAEAAEGGATVAEGGSAAQSPRLVRPGRRFPWLRRRQP